MTKKGNKDMPAHRRAFARSMGLGRARRNDEDRKALAARNAYRTAIGLPPIIPVDKPT